MYRFWNDNGSSITTLMFVLGIGVIAAPAQAAQWSTPVQPPDGCRSTPSGAPSLALNAIAEWVIAAYAQTGSGLEAFTVSACTSNDGVNWSGPITVGQGTSPAVAIAPDGHAIAVWQGGPATSPNVQASIRPAGGSWSAPVVVSTIAGHPLLGIDGAGNAIAVWAGTTLATPVATASLPAGGRWTTAQTLVEQAGGIGLTTGTLTYASRRPSGGTWGAPTLLSATNDKGGVRVAGDDAGTFVVIWNDATGHVEAVTVPSGGGFSPGVPVGTSPSNGLLVPG